MDPIEDFIAINQELESFGHGLKAKPQVVVFNKIDVPGVQDVLPLLEDELQDLGFDEVHAISAFEPGKLAVPAVACLRTGANSARATTGTTSTGCRPS